jgi:hypothetical protein
MWRVEQQPIQGTQTSGFYATADAMLTQQLYGGIANMPEYGGTATMAARKEQKFDSVSLESVASLVPRQSITDFSKLMEYRLTQHDHWGGWDDVGIWALYDQLQNAYNEAYYSLALRRYDRYEGNDKAGTIHSNAPHADVPKIARYVAEQFADVANYAMMIAENAQRLADEYTKGKK